MPRKGNKNKNPEIADILYKQVFGNRTTNKSKKTVKATYSKFEETTFERQKFNEALENFKPTVQIYNIDNAGLSTFSEEVNCLKEKYEKQLYIPKRPIGVRNMNVEELKEAESDNYYRWRRDMLAIEEDKRVTMTPFEINLDFWRQLWRVIERSDVLVQILDARNPLLYRSKALEDYIHEVDKNKMCILLINKADYLNEKQRKIWAQYFEKENIRVYFWSAKDAEEYNKHSQEMFTDIIEVNETEDGKDVDENEESCQNEDGKDAVEGIDEVEDEDSIESISDDESTIDDDDDVKQNSSEKEEVSETNLTKNTDEEPEKISEHINEIQIEDPTDQIKNSWRILSRKEIIATLEAIKVPNQTNEYKTVGLIGYPNVGKSSTINAIFGRKKTSVSATPGRTKSFTTLHVSKTLVLCDCPGLIFPSVVNNKAELINAGILPIDKIRDIYPSINVISCLFPKEILEGFYTIEIKNNKMGTYSGQEFLAALAFTRGLIGKTGNPIVDRAGRMVLKDFTSGKLLYRHPPPGVDPVEFEAALPLSKKKQEKILEKSKKQIDNTQMIEEKFFETAGFTKKTINIPTTLKVNGDEYELKPEFREDLKPWRKTVKKGKKEKARRLYRHLDQ